MPSQVPPEPYREGEDRAWSNEGPHHGRDMLGRLVSDRTVGSYGRLEEPEDQREYRPCELLETEGQPHWMGHKR